MNDDYRYIEPVRHWVNRVVIGLNFCPFAKPELDHTRFSVCYHRKVKAVLNCLNDELEYLQHHPDVATSLLILPQGFALFNDYLKLLERADGFVDQQGYRGDYQLASFHPEYQFEGEPADDPANYTNRAPYPVLHLLRESAIDKALASYRDPQKIPQRNIDKARKMGSQALKTRLRNCSDI